MKKRNTVTRLRPTEKELPFIGWTPEGEARWNAASTGDPVSDAERGARYAHQALQVMRDQGRIPLITRTILSMPGPEGATNIEWAFLHAILAAAKPATLTGPEKALVRDALRLARRACA